MATSKKSVETAEVAETVEVVEAQSILESEMAWQKIRQQERDNASQRRAQIINDLYEPFPAEVERQLKKSGTFLTYIPVSEVINRLNKVLGFDGWSYEIIRCERDALDPDFIVAHVRMSIFPEADRFVSVTKDGFGGQKIKRTKAGDIVDLGDEFKGAVSDALKKAAQALGVGLYLARTEEAMEATEIQSAPPVPAPPVVPVSPIVKELWDTFVSLSKSLDADGKATLNSFWTEFSGGAPKPTLATATVAQLEALIQECVRMAFSGDSSDE